MAAAPAMSAPFMQLYVADYLGDTRHLDRAARRLSAASHGNVARRRALPNDDAKLARIVRIVAGTAADRTPTSSPVFDVDGANITQKRLVAEIERSEGKVSQTR